MQLSKPVQMSPSSATLVARTAEWALAQPTSASYVQVTLNGDWVKRSCGQPDCVAHVYKVAMGAKTFKRGELADLYDTRVQALARSERRLMVFFQGTSMPEAEIARIRQDSERSLDQKGYWYHDLRLFGTYVFMADDPCALTYAAVVEAMYDAYLFADVRPCAIISIIEGMCLGYAKHDIMSYLSNVADVQIPRRRELRLKSFEKEWREAKRLLNAACHDDPEVASRVARIRSRAFPLADLYDRAQTADDAWHKLFSSGQV